MTVAGPQSFPMRRGPHLPQTSVTDTACDRGQSGPGGLKSGVMAGLPSRRWSDAADYQEVTGSRHRELRLPVQALRCWYPLPVVIQRPCSPRVNVVVAVDPLSG